VCQQCVHEKVRVHVCVYMCMCVHGELYLHICVCIMIDTPRVQKVCVSCVCVGERECVYVGVYVPAVSVCERVCVCLFVRE